ncbi:MAG: hypothetical protein Q4G71_17480 [Pseudomonadota bacterium]|nr:hypothetical protein [Pseudomonadota bacterium]
MTSRLLIAAALLAALAACGTHGPAPADPSTVATPAAAAARAQALALPPDLPDSVFAPWLATERARIARERSAAEQRFDTAEKACWRRFAVNDCVKRARAERRATTDALRQQDLALNAHERQRRTDERLRGLGLAPAAGADKKQALP